MAGEAATLAVGGANALSQNDYKVRSSDGEEGGARARPALATER